VLFQFQLQLIEITLWRTGARGLSCRKSAGRGARHTAINSIVKAALSSAETPNCHEPRGRARYDGKRSNRRRDIDVMEEW